MSDFNYYFLDEEDLYFPFPIHEWWEEGCEEIYVHPNPPDEDNPFIGEDCDNGDILDILDYYDSDD